MYQDLLCLIYNIEPRSFIRFRRGNIREVTKKVEILKEEIEKSRTRTNVYMKK